MGRLVMNGQLLPLIVVLVAVCLNVMSAVVLKTMADWGTLTLWVIAGGLSTALAINIARFLVWGYAHKKFPLSKTYPLGGLFFPMMLVVAYLYGEPASWRQIVGALLILSGVGWLTWRVKE